jgi:uncharacterized protein YndB with AHSA1/START domain
MILLTASSELDIAAPSERVFDLLAPERTSEWDHSILSIAQIRGPLGPGARYRETHRVFFRPHAIDLEVTEYEPSQRIAYRTVSGGPPSTTRYELVPSPQLTRVRISAEARIGSLLVVLAPLLRRVIRRQLPETLRALKSHCDALPAANPMSH